MAGAMRIQAQINIQDMRTTTKVKSEKLDPEDVPIKTLVTQITIEVAASAALSARLTALQQMLNMGQPVSAIITCDQATFDLEVTQVLADGQIVHKEKASSLVPA